MEYFQHTWVKGTYRTQMLLSWPNSDVLPHHAHQPPNRGSHNVLLHRTKWSLPKVADILDLPMLQICNIALLEEKPCWCYVIRGLLDMPLDILPHCAHTQCFYLHLYVDVCGAIWSVVYLEMTCSGRPLRLPQCCKTYQCLLRLTHTRVAYCPVAH